MFSRVIDRRARYCGERLPKYYGVTYERMDTMEIVCHPIPLNIMARRVRAVWMRLKNGLCPTAWEQDLMDAFDSGKKEGMDIGIKRGRNDAATAGITDELEAIRAMKNSGYYEK